MNKLKTLYCGTFQTRKKLYIEMAMAYSERQAWLIFCRRIAKKSGHPLNLIMDWFSDPVNYTIKVEIKYKEVEE